MGQMAVRVSPATTCRWSYRLRVGSQWGTMSPSRFQGWLGGAFRQLDDAVLVAVGTVEGAPKTGGRRKAGNVPLAEKSCCRRRS